MIWISKSLKDTIAIGDGFNDIPMFEASDEAYATADACEALKGIATGVIGKHDEDCVAKWLAMHPQIIILDEPTKGIDVGAKAEVHKIIDNLAKQGFAVIIISSELPEVIGASDRIIVMYEGRITGRFDSTQQEITQDLLMTSASGIVA